MQRRTSDPCTSELRDQLTTIMSTTCPVRRRPFALCDTSTCVDTSAALISHPGRQVDGRCFHSFIMDARHMSILFLLQFSQFYTHPREHALIIINFTVRDGMHVKFSPEQFVHSDLHTGSLPRLSYQLISPHSHTNPPGDAETLYRPQSALFTIRFYFTQYCSQKKSNKFTGRSCQ